MTRERAAAALEYYLGHTPTERYATSSPTKVFAGWCWYLWALVKEAERRRGRICSTSYYSHATRTIIPCSLHAGHLDLRPFQEG